MIPLDIILINPPQPFLLVKSHYPIGLALLGKKLEKVGHNVIGIDLKNNISEINSNIPEADWYLFSSTTPSYPNVIKIGKQIRKKYPNASFVIGGAHASALPEKVLSDGMWNFVVIGEADEKIVSIVKNDFKQGIIKCTPPIEIDDFPNYSKFLFQPPSLKIGYIPAANIITSRGCPHKCKFCSSGGIVYRKRSVDGISDEIKQLKLNGYRGIVINDDSPVLNDEHLDNICKVMSNHKMLFRMNLRAEQVSKQRVKLLKKSGCNQINIGVEVVNNFILESIRKNVTVDQSIRAFEILNKYGIKNKALLIFGLPGTGREENMAIVDFIKKARPTYVMLSSFFPLPGSPCFTEMKEEIEALNINIFNFFYYGKDGNSRIVNNHFPNGVLSSEELAKLKRELWDAIEGLGITEIDCGEISYNDSLI